MTVDRRVFVRAAVVFALLGAALLLSGVPRAVAVMSHKPLNDTRPVGIGAVHLTFPIEYFGLVAEVDAPATALPETGRAPFGQARFLVRGRWTSWQSLDQDGAQQRGHFTGALIAVDHATAYQVRALPDGAHNWRAAAINTTDGPTVVVGHGVTGAASAASNCRSRADWGADESMTAWSKGTDTQTFYPVQTLTVHHTAGSNDLNQDYSATVRAIYSYDIQTNGWSDLSYQYLIDGNGIVYEGRNAGHTSLSCLTQAGTGSDFAHQTGTDYMVTGAHVANYNAGNMGIALMGCYDSSSACSGNTTPPGAAVDSLESLLASLSTRHNLNPQGTANYVNPINGYAKTVNTVSGHRDWAATACPGGNLYAELPQIRANVAARMTNATTPTAPASAAATTSGSAVNISWSPPVSDGGSPITTYDVFRDSATAPIYSGLATSTTDSPPAGTHTYSIRACNAIGCGPVTTSNSVTTSSPPAAITSGSCSGASCSFTGTGTGTLSWSFGNGKSATGSPVSTKYTTSGNYVVTLTDTTPTSATRPVSCTTVKRHLSCTT